MELRVPRAFPLPKPSKIHERSKKGLVHQIKCDSFFIIVIAIRSGPLLVMAPLSAQSEILTCIDSLQSSGPSRPSFSVIDQ